MLHNHSIILFRQKIPINKRLLFGYFDCFQEIRARDFVYYRIDTLYFRDIMFLSIYCTNLNRLLLFRDFDQGERHGF